MNFVLCIVLLCLIPIGEWLNIHNATALCKTQICVGMIGLCNSPFCYLYLLFEHKRVNTYLTRSYVI